MWILHGKKQIMSNSFIAFLGGERGEEKKMWLLLGKGFFMGIFLATYQIGAETLFLQTIGQDYLDIAFFTAGILGIFVTAIFVFLQTRIKYSSLLLTNVLLIFIFLVMSRTAFEIKVFSTSTGEFAVLPFILFVMIGPITAITLLGFWGAFGRLFDSRQSKRIIGGIDTGQLTATMIAFFSVPGITRLPFVDDTYDLLFVSCFAAFGVLLFSVRIVARYNLDKISQPEDNSRKAPQKVKFLDSIKNPYLRLLSFFLIFSMGASVFVDYTFYTATETMFPEEQKLSDFLSTFNGTVMIMSFLIQSFVNDIIIGRFGLKVALMTMPAILILFTLGAIISGHIYGFEFKTKEYLLFFMFTVSAKAFTASLRDALESPAFKLFFLPIDVRIRFDIQTRIEGLVNQTATLVAGAAQIGLGLLAFFELIHFSYFIIGMAIMILWLSSKVFLEYKVTLKQTLKRQKEALQGEGTKNEETVRHLLKSEASSKSPIRIQNTMKLFERLDAIEFEYALLEQLNSRYADIRLLAYQKLEELLCFNALGAIKKESETEGDEKAKQQSIRTIKTLKSAIGIVLTDTLLRKLVRSTRSEDRKYAAHLLSNLEDDAHVVYLLELLRDINPSVRSVALISAGKIKRSEVYPILIENLHLATYGNSASAALAFSGEPAFHNIDTSFYKTGQHNSTMVRIVQILGKIGGRKSIELLWKKIDYPNKRIVSEILNSLSYIGFKAGDFQSARIKLILENKIGEIAWNIKALRELPLETEIDHLISDAIKEENDATIDNIFMLLSMIYDPQNIKLIKQNILARTIDSVTFGIEMLDLFCDEGLKPKLFPVLDDLQDDQKLSKLNDHYPPESFDSYRDMLFQIINRDYNKISRYTKALSLYRISQMDTEKKNTSEKITYDIIANLFNLDKLMLQTAAFTIYKLDEESYHKNTARLKTSVKKELDRAILPPVFVTKEEFYHQKLLLIEKILFIKRFPHFQLIPGEVITHIAEILDEIRFESGTKIIDIEDNGNEPVYMIRSGKVRITYNDGKEYYLAEGEIFGEKLISEHDKFDFKAITTEATILLVLRKEELLDLMTQHISIVRNYLKILDGEFDKKIEMEENLQMGII